MGDQDLPQNGRKTTVIVQLAELRKDVNVLQRHDLDHAEAISKLKTATVEHRMRLENGVKVFADQKERLSTVEEKTTPKAPSILKIVGLTLGLVSMGAGALVGLNNMLRDRPTVGQVDKFIKAHDDSGHKAVREDINKIERTQALQHKSIKDLSDAQKTTAKKIDTLLDRVPEPSRRRRRRP